MEHDTTLLQQLQAAEEYVRSLIGQERPQMLLILGSGLSHVAEQIENPLVVPFVDVPYLSEATVKEHPGQFVFGMLGGKRVLAMQGRVHGYEGYTAQQVAFPVWLAHRLGANTLFTTNAAGGIDERFEVGDFCVMTDHINFMGRNPIAGNQALELGPRFFSMEDAYDAQLRETALRVGRELGITVQEGVYLGLLGPSFETPAEIRAFAQWGASTVAMSVCEEVIAARQVSMRVLGLSMISNLASGLGSTMTAETDLEKEAADVFALTANNATRLVVGIVAAIDF